MGAQHGTCKPSESAATWPLTLLAMSQKGQVLFEKTTHLTEGEEKASEKRREPLKVRRVALDELLRLLHHGETALPKEPSRNTPQHTPGEPP